MHSFRSNLLLFSAYIFATLVVVVSSTPNEEKGKTSKHFSLFSVVTFQNTECTTSASLAGGSVDGTCFTSTECSDKGGTKSGNCASGFGVCCAILNTGEVASTIKENRTRIRNSEYPNIDTTTTVQSIVYTVAKMKTDICQLRLDFTKFQIAGPSNSLEDIVTGAGTMCTDTLKITTTDITDFKNTPHGALCGALTGEHLYVELSPTSTDGATITLDTVATGTLTPTAAQRLWDIKVSQIECHATYRAPPGCQKYLMADGGKIISYNFLRLAGTSPTGATSGAATTGNSGLELAHQRINTCIRRSKGMCCVEYQVCASYNSIALVGGLFTSGGNDGADGTFNEGWSIDTNTSPYLIAAITINIGMVDSQCTSDYVEIPSSWSASCGAGTSSARNHIYTRYCGALLGHVGVKGNAIAPFQASTPVCDCSEPFRVRHVADEHNNIGGMVYETPDLITAVATAGTGNRGFCLDYKQIPCWQ